MFPEVEKLVNKMPDGSERTGKEKEIGKDSEISFRSSYKCHTPIKVNGEKRNI